MAENLVAAAALAGGASSRMGRPKALMPFLGEPLVARVLARLRAQAGVVYLNAEGQDYAGFGAPLTPDSPRWRGAGPLAGVAAALTRAAAEGFAYLATAPCDAPFAPADLVARLAAAGAPALAVSASGPEPTFALWPVGALGAVETALRAGHASPSAVLAALGAAHVSFPVTDGLDPFANLNTPEEFAAAEAAARMLEQARSAAGRR
jgi:molybdopterin-guanine dinucleotide biosynthesis protein A